jgi:hypothetical protein
MYGQHDPAPRLSASQARLVPANTIHQAAQTPHLPLPSSLSLSLPRPPSRAIPQPGPLTLPPRPLHLPTSTQSAAGRAVPFFPPGPSMINHPLGVASTTGVATPLPYSTYATPPPLNTSTRALGKRKRSQGRATQLLESVVPRRYELIVVIDCQAVSLSESLVLTHLTVFILHSLMETAQRQVLTVYDHMPFMLPP